MSACTARRQCIEELRSKREELNKTMNGLGSKPETSHENPVEAFFIASRLAADRGCDLMVIGSVYLIGDLFRHMAESNGWGLWEALTAH